MSNDLNAIKKQMQENLDKATALIKETVELADKNGLDFQFNGPTDSLSDYYWAGKNGDKGYWDRGDEGWSSSDRDC